VYIIDTGLDTTHAEFTSQTSNPRTVKNIYNSFASNKNNPGPNSDDNGHGMYFVHIMNVVGY
jgi:subtilisin family serine protease